MKRKLAIVGIVLLIVFIVCVISLGRWSESQFSPETFQHRSRWGYNIPFTDVELVSFVGEPALDPIVSYWRQKGYLRKLPTQTDIWHVSFGRRSSNRLGYTGYAEGFWLKAINVGDHRRSFWIDWSKQHPKAADRMWPMIITCLKATARGDKYCKLYRLANEVLLRLASAEPAGPIEQIIDTWKAEIKQLLPDLDLES